MESIFVGRTAELDNLNSFLQKKSASLIVIKGRRRIGKSRLIEEFAKGQKFYEFVGLPPKAVTKASDEREIQRSEFVRQMAEQGIPGVNAKDWGDIFWHLAQHTKTGRVIISLDEISWLADGDSDFLPKLKNAWAIHFKKNVNVFIC